MNMKPLDWPFGTAFPIRTPDEALAEARAPEADRLSLV